MRLKKYYTDRDFARIDFQDYNGEECSIQESSLATKEAIWLGQNHGTHLDTGECLSRMHLTRSQVKKLLPYLHRFVSHGCIGWPREAFKKESKKKR